MDKFVKIEPIHRKAKMVSKEINTSPDRTYVRPVKSELRDSQITDTY